MKIVNITNILKTIKPGTFTSISYESDCPVRAALVKQGYKVKKSTSMVARFNINYGSIKEVIKKNAEREAGGEVSKSRTNNFVAIVKNCLYHNTNTGNDYLNVYTTKIPNIKSEYFVCEGDNNWKPVSLDYIKEMDYLIDSYYKRTSSDPTPMFRINVDNVTSIKGVLV